MSVDEAGCPVKRAFVLVKRRFVLVKRVSVDKAGRLIDDGVCTIFDVDEDEDEVDEFVDDEVRTIFDKTMSFDKAGCLVIEATNSFSGRIDFRLLAWKVWSHELTNPGTSVPVIINNWLLELIERKREGITDGVSIKEILKIFTDLKNIIDETGDKDEIEDKLVTCCVGSAVELWQEICFMGYGEEVLEKLAESFDHSFTMMDFVQFLWLPVPNDKYFETNLKKWRTIITYFNMVITPFE